MTPADHADPRALEALLASPPDLPVVAGLPRLRSLLASPTLDSGAPAVVVTAPPGTGKTTLVPPLVALSLGGANRPDGAGEAGEAGRVIVTQPRRVAARAAAMRLASLLGEDVGGTVGYAVRGQRRTGPSTRIEVVTAGLLLRRLQAEPDLPGVGAVILDEVHERALDADLLLALLLDARAGLREDLALIAMSATLDAGRLRELLGGAVGGAGSARDAGASLAPLLEVPGAPHPIVERWAPPPATTARLGPHGVPADFLAHVAGTAARAMAENDGDALVFLPGAREVDDVVARLRRILRTERGGGSGDGPGDVDVLPLHGRLPAAAQDAALAPSAPGLRRVVVSTNVAESSLTVPGVRIVVDSTLAREPRLDVARSMSSLVTVGESRSAGVQRAGRAGREGPGAVYRCCTPSDWARAAASPTPEILSADLTRLALELAAWGAPDGAGLHSPAWIDPPPEAAMRTAEAALVSLGLVEQAGRDDDAGGGRGAEDRSGGSGPITPLGRTVAAIPAPVREARALLVAAALIGARPAARAAALLTADLRAPGADLAALAKSVRGRRESAADPRGTAQWVQEAERLERAVTEALAGAGAARGAGGAAGAQGALRSLISRSADGARLLDGLDGLDGLGGPGGTGWTGGAEESVALLAALAHPEWIARRRGPTGPSITAPAATAGPSSGRARAEAAYASVGGTGLRLPADSPLASSQWLAVADVDRSPGRSDALIRAAAPLDEELALAVAADRLSEETRTVWAQGRLRTERARRLGAIVLATTPGPPPGPGEAASAVARAVREEGPGILPWSDEARELRGRLALLRTEIGEPWPEVDDESLVGAAETWLGPAVRALAVDGRRFDLGRLDMVAALRALLPWPEAARFDELAPERLDVPSGSRVRLAYTGDDGEPLARPVLAVRVQECFGWAGTPRVAGGRVPVLIHLLSPARRPVAVTDDLASFWRQGYPRVRAELRGRYPKHAWPEDPWSAPATRGTGRRRPRG
ncbi:ATP-dependent helicase HrpB [Actinomyces sp. Chiba101]|uniref:ATP-dependent RNA helicase n=1 Tax=Actinomyces TaxID=1654 RepID=UPI000974E674|nr:MULTISPECIES: ATP-dependent helicase C-terminal domain-containing protein [Actinomyces]BAW94098.1 ATP-dependent helicase HrpB [Actinomyces sp. Chiba101]SUU13911.1 ATP-dependent RNA helicase HrpB [Actinomyces denticolens]